MNSSVYLKKKNLCMVPIQIFLLGVGFFFWFFFGFFLFFLPGAHLW